MNKSLKTFVLVLGIFLHHEVKILRDIKITFCHDKLFDDLCMKFSI